MSSEHHRGNGPVIAWGRFLPAQRSIRMEELFSVTSFNAGPSARIHSTCVFADLVLRELPEKLYAPTPTVHIPAQITIMMSSLLASVPAAVQKRCQSSMGTGEK